MSPYPLLWLRYSTFILLYPLGVASEMTMVWLALPHIRRSHMWSIDLPNAVNFAFDYFFFCLLAVIIYIPGGTKAEAAPNKLTLDAPGKPIMLLKALCAGFPVLYLHMLHQRKKVLGQPKSKTA